MWLIYQPFSEGQVNIAWQSQRRLASGGRAELRGAHNSQIANPTTINTRTTSSSGLIPGWALEVFRLPWPIF